jgi:hypothetical protein
VFIGRELTPGGHRGSQRSAPGADDRPSAAQKTELPRARDTAIRIGFKGDMLTVKQRSR